MVEWGEQTGFVVAEGKHCKRKVKEGRFLMDMQVNVELCGRIGRRRLGRIRSLMIDMCVGATDVEDKLNEGTGGWT
jgi:predicted Fe-Mo cluster-binding NifX family protein